MYLVNTKRGLGKTHSMILDSAKTGATIIVPTGIQVRLIRERAKELGVEIPTPVSAFDIRGNKVDNRDINGYLIDELPQVLSVLLGEEVIGATSTMRVLDIY